MRILRTTFAIGVIILAPALATAGAFTIDPTASSVSFTVRLLTREVPGSFSKFQGTLVQDPSDPLKISAKGSVATASITTKKQERDQHLMSPDYFDAERYPDMTFEGSGIARANRGDFDITGKLTIKNITKVVTFHIHPISEGPPFKWEAKATINRKDFGVVHHAWADRAIGDKVEITLEIQGHSP